MFICTHGTNAGPGLRAEYTGSSRDEPSGGPTGTLDSQGGYSLEPDGCLLQVIDVKEPAEKDIQAGGSKQTANPFVNTSVN